MFEMSCKTGQQRPNIKILYPALMVGARPQVHHNHDSSTQN